MTSQKNFPCDVCGATYSIEVPHCREYTNGQPLQICAKCGFVYVRERRSAQAIADSWSNDLYGSGYTARIPAVRARQSYVAETIDVELGLRGKRLVDIGGGEGQFLEMARSSPYDANVFAIEPSASNCGLLSKAGIENFNGTIEAYSASGAASRRFDIATIMWTLENCMSCNDMLDAAWNIIAPRGHLVVATGSRILVPFKKPLNLYLSRNPADTHCFRFSAHSLQNLMRKAGFEPVFVNRYLDSEYLLVIGQRTDRTQSPKLTADDPQAVANFFSRWHKETADHYAGN